MTQTPDPRLDAVLQSGQAADWQAQLTAAFFDADAKRQCIAAIRAGVADLSPGLAGPELTRLQNAVVHRLVGVASQHARPPAARRNPLFRRLPGASWKRLSSAPIPTPSPCPFAASEQESATADFGCLLDTFESLVHFLAAVAVSAYLPQRPGKQGVQPLSCSNASARRLEHGRFVRPPARHGAAGRRLRRPAALPKLPAYLFTRRQADRLAARCLNRSSPAQPRLGSRHGRDEAFFAGTGPRQPRRLEQELALASWLARWQLIRPLVIDDAGRVARSTYSSATCASSAGRRARCAPAGRSLGRMAATFGGRKRCCSSPRTGSAICPCFRCRCSISSCVRRAFTSSSARNGGGARESAASPGVLRGLPVRAGRARRKAPANRRCAPWNCISSGSKRAWLAGDLPGPAAVEDRPAEDPDRELAEVRHEQEFHLQYLRRQGKSPGRGRPAGSTHRARDGYLLLSGRPDRASRPSWPSWPAENARAAAVCCTW